MNTIDKYNAPRGCIAVSPDESSPDGIGECGGCCFDSGYDSGCVLDMQHDYVSTPCWAEGREDKQDVIFKREESPGDGSAVTNGCLKKSLDNPLALGRCFSSTKK